MRRRSPGEGVVWTSDEGGAEPDRRLAERLWLDRAGGSRRVHGRWSAAVYERVVQGHGLHTVGRRTTARALHHVAQAEATATDTAVAGLGRGAKQLINEAVASVSGLVFKVMESTPLKWA